LIFKNDSLHVVLFLQQLQWLPTRFAPESNNLYGHFVKEKKRAIAD